MFAHVDRSDEGIHDMTNEIELKCGKVKEERILVFYCTMGGRVSEPVAALTHQFSLFVGEGMPGIPLYDRVFSWKPDQRDPSSCASLVQFFYSFAVDMDDGRVHRVVFQEAEPPVSSGTQGPAMGLYGLSAVTHPSLASGYNDYETKLRRTSRQKRSAKSIQMACIDNKMVVVAVFVNQVKFSDPENLVPKSLLKLFTQQFRRVLLDLQPKFTEVAAHDEPLSNVSFMPHFAAFDAVVDSYGFTKEKPAARDAGGRASDRSSASTANSVAPAEPVEAGTMPKISA
eukprot:g73703.t1